MTLSTSARVFRVTPSNTVFISAVGIIGISFFSYFAVILCENTGARAWLWGLLFGIFALLIASMVASSLVARLELRPWTLDYRGLLGRKQIQIRDVTSLDWRSGRGFRGLAIRAANRNWFMVSNYSFSNDDLEAIADFVYLGAEATSNPVLKRPVRQLRPEDIPQVSFKDIPQRRL